MLLRNRIKPIDKYIRAKITLGLLSVAHVNLDVFNQVLQQKKVFSQFIRRILRVKNYVNSSYERKVYVIGISVLLSTKEMPEYLRIDTLATLLKNCAATLNI